MGPETNAVDIEHKGFYILSGQCKKILFGREVWKSTIGYLSCVLFINAKTVKFRASSFNELERIIFCLFLQGDITVLSVATNLKLPSTFQKRFFL